MHVLYSQEGKTSVKSLEGDFSINNAFNPINLGAKWKLLISRAQKLILDKPNFSLKFMFLSYSYKFTSI